MTTDQQDFIVRLSETAAKKIQEIRVSEAVSEDEYIRVKIIGGGCSGYQYDMYFDKQTADDKVIESHGIKLLVDPMSAMYFVGTTIDFLDGLSGTGFKFNNPSAKTSCGCGKSVSF